MINFLSLYLIEFNFCFWREISYFPSHRSRDFKHDQIKRLQEILIQLTILKTPTTKQKSNDRYKSVRQPTVEWQRGEPRVSNFLKSYTSSRHTRRQAVASRYIATLQQRTPLRARISRARGIVEHRMVHRSRGAIEMIEVAAIEKKKRAIEDKKKTERRGRKEAIEKKGKR